MHSILILITSFGVELSTLGTIRNQLVAAQEDKELLLLLGFLLLELEMIWLAVSEFRLLSMEFLESCLLPIDYLFGVN